MFKYDRRLYYLVVLLTEVKRGYNYTSMTKKSSHTREYFENLKMPRDKTTPDDILALGLDEQLSTLKRRLNHYLQFNRFNEKQRLAIEQAPLRHPRGLGRYVEEARLELGIVKDAYISTGETGTDSAYGLEPWLADCIGQIDGYVATDDEYAKRLSSAINNIIKKCNLSPAWHEYLVEYIATNNPPIHAKIHKEEHIKVDRIDDNTVTITFTRNHIDDEDLAIFPKIIAPFVKQPQNALTPYGQKDLINQDRKSNTSYRDLAKIHYPKQYKKDSASAITRVKQAIRRMKSTETL